MGVMIYVVNVFIMTSRIVSQKHTPHIVVFHFSMPEVRNNAFV